MIQTDGDKRRLGAYHHGMATKVGSVRLPVEKFELVKARFTEAGWTFAEGIERLIDTELLRKR